MLNNKNAPSTCNYCNKSFLTWQYQLNRGLGKYCSKSCVTAYRNTLNTQNHKQVFFKNTIIPENKNDCWIYQCGKTHKYGSIKSGGIKILAHRFSYELYKGEIPNGMLVCHICDMPKCVNPAHLFIGTPNDNVQDMIQKGRERYRKGSECTNAKLTEQIVKDIKNKLAQGIKSKQLEKEYNLRQSQISRIKTGNRWKHVTIDGD